MPRNLQNGLQELLNRPDAQIETHSTLQLSIDRPNLQTAFYWATADLTINGVAYSGQLRGVDDIVTSITRSADGAPLQLQNVDTLLGINLLNLGDALYGAEIKAGRYWRDLDTKSEFHKVLLTGGIAEFEEEENFVTLEGVSDPYTLISVGPKREVRRLCTYRFRQADTCGYAGSLLTCNLMFADTDGCSGRFASPAHRAHNGGFVYLSSKTGASGA